ncbi:MAG: response regulator [Endomicrobiales bacterium]|nr:response regulator [Endomicrobiales bacterium]
MKTHQETTHYFRCSICGIITRKGEDGFAFDRKNKCCESASEEYFVPWPSAPLRKLVALTHEQDMATLETQQTAIVGLSTVINTLMEELVFRLLRNASKNAKNHAYDFCSSVSRDVMFRLYDELSEVPLQAYLKSKGFSSFINQYRSFMSLRDKMVHTHIKEHTLDDVDLVMSLRNDCLEVFALLNNEISRKTTRTLKQIKKAMIVDDDEDMARLIGQLLRKEGLEIVMAFSGKEAIDKYKLHKPDIVFLDIAIPDIDGIGVLMEIKKFDENATVYFVTGIGGEVFRDQVKELGAKGHLTKPIYLSDILSIIKGVS